MVKLYILRFQSKINNLNYKVFKFHNQIYFHWIYEKIKKHAPKRWKEIWYRVTEIRKITIEFFLPVLCSKQENKHHWTGMESPRGSQYLWWCVLYHRNTCSYSFSNHHCRLRTSYCGCIGYCQWWMQSE
jgi:hypothetical protein